MFKCCWKGSREEGEVKHIGERVHLIMSCSWENGKEWLVGLWVGEGHIFYYTEGKEELSKYRWVCRFGCLHEKTWVFSFLAWWLSNKESACNAEDSGDLGSIPRCGRGLREGHDNPLHYSCLENPMDRGTWQTSVHRIAKSRTRLKQRSRGNFPCP